VALHPASIGVILREVIEAWPHLSTSDRLAVLRVVRQAKGASHVE
jgi:hypothetical protein